MANPNLLSEETHKKQSESAKRGWAARRMNRSVNGRFAPPEPDPPAVELERMTSKEVADLAGPDEPYLVEAEYPKTTSVGQRTRAAEARWLGEQSTEQDLRRTFLELPLNQALALHDRMRKNLDITGRILNERINVPELQKCQHCGISFEDFTKTSHRNDWVLNRPHYDAHDRQIIRVQHFCSMACVAMSNQGKDGIVGVSDRGMLRSDNPKNHPRESIRQLHDKAI